MSRRAGRSPARHTARKRIRPQPQADPFRVLTIITRLDLGGAQQVALYTLAGLPCERFRAFLISGPGGLLDGQAKSLPGVQVNLWRALKHSVRPWWDAVACLRLAAFMRRHKIDLVHTHSSKAGILGRAAARLAGVRHVVHTVHGWPFHAFQPAWLRALYVLLEKLAARWTTVLVAVSQATRDQGLQLGIGRPEQYQVIFPGSDLAPFRPGTKQQREAVRKEFHFPGQALVVGMVACLKPQKAPLDLVSAAALVQAACPEARFLIVGDGELRPALDDELVRLGLQEQVKLTGWRQDVPALMAGFDLLAHSAKWEGLPCVFAQAQAAGLAVVATDVGGAAEAIIPGRTGLLVPAGQPEALARGIIELLQNPDRRKTWGRAGRIQSRKFSLEIMQQKMLEIYKNIVKN